MTKYARKNQLKHAEMQGNKEQIAPGETGSRKMTRKSQKQIENQSQSGRSMVEMLGVLAIIAILSIGGIIGFRLAMNYYQANQIAHEMNMMRTDAQIKIAQGTEKLMLGEPYDPISESTLGHIQFNDDYPVDFACALADDEAVELSNISCHVANAYYIELQNIPEGVCRPLAELVNGMNNIIAFDVNKNEYPETGKCEAGNGNVLNAVFSAEAVSELKVCTEDTDCESENALYCDPSRHVCVRCYEDSQCEHNQYCEDNTCVTCESGVWNGEECVECTADNDCTDKTDTPVCNTAEYKCVECLTYNDCTDTPETPQCDDESHTCKSCIDIDSSKPVWADTQCVQCVNSTDCSDELVCKENTCSPCETEDECQAKGTTYHCSKEDTCIQCATNEVWDDESKGCVECTADNDCTDTPDTPKCNTTTNQCVPCLVDSDCENPTPICSEENTCVACKTNEECRLKNPSEENCVTGGACCDDPLMTWNGSECVCPEDYAKSETSSGQAVCLPYCKQEVGVVLMVDQSSSLGWKNHDASQYSNDLYKENAQKIQKVISKLNIPDKLKAAVYLSGCYDEGGCNGGVCQYDKVPMPLSFGKHSAAEIKAALQIELEGRPAGPCNYFINPLKHITQNVCQTGQEKLIIVVFYDVDMTDNPYFNALKQKCPQSIIYNIAFEGHTFDAATKTYDLDQVLSNETTMQEYAEILNKEFKDHLCVERE